MIEEDAKEEAVQPSQVLHLPLTHSLTLSTLSAEEPPERKEEAKPVGGDVRPHRSLSAVMRVRKA